VDSVEHSLFVSQLISFLILGNFTLGFILKDVEGSSVTDSLVLTISLRIFHEVYYPFNDNTQAPVNEYVFAQRDYGIWCTVFPEVLSKTNWRLHIDSQHNVRNKDFTYDTSNFHSCKKLLRHLQFQSLKNLLQDL
jgi:hypothetical protein